MMYYLSQATSVGSEWAELKYLKATLETREN